MNLYHYCPNAAFVSIVSRHEIWASDFSLSNDFLEGKWIGEIFKACCRERGVRDFEQAKLLEDLSGVSSIVGGVGFCMSEEPDLLSQWWAYANDGAGVSIGFSKEYFDALGNLRMNRNEGFNLVILRVEYGIEKQREIISEHADEIIRLVSEGGLRTCRQSSSSHPSRLICFIIASLRLFREASTEVRKKRMSARMRN
jgi:hypothetical protein